MAGNYSLNREWLTTIIKTKSKGIAPCLAQSPIFVALLTNRFKVMENFIDFKCNGPSYLDLRKKKIELLRMHLPDSDERQEIEKEINKGNVESVSYTKDEVCASLTVLYYSGGESIFRL